MIPHAALVTGYEQPAEGRRQATAGDHPRARRVQRGRKPPARPRVSSAPITLQNLENSEGNILFFGDFANLPEGDFVEGMLDLLEERRVVYETMIRNIHGLGLVLRKKFALLQVAYTAFMLALVAGVLSFIAVFVWILQQAPA
jgi:hypothetical protein